MRMRRPTNQDLLEVCADVAGARPVEIAHKLQRGINATYLAVADLERRGLIERDESGRYHAVPSAGGDEEHRGANDTSPDAD